MDGNTGGSRLFLRPYREVLQIFYSEDHTQALAITSEYLFTAGISLPPNLATITETVPRKELDRKISALREPLLPPRAEPTRRAKEREQRIAVDSLDG